MEITQFFIKFIPGILLLTAFTVAAQIPNSGGQVWTVKRAPDGDTITAVNSVQSLKVRFACIDSPEKSQPGGIEARDYLRNLLDKANRKVEIEPQQTDRYGRTVAEVFVRIDGRRMLVNEAMVKAGHAYFYRQYPNCRNRNAIENAESIAKSQRIGVWSNPENIKPWDYRRTRRDNSK